MDRRRLETAHLKYACLKMAAHFSETINISCIGVEGDVINTLKEITPVLFQSFEAKYAGWFILVATVEHVLNGRMCIIRCVLESYLRSCITQVIIDRLAFYICFLCMFF